MGLAAGRLSVIYSLCFNVFSESGDGMTSTLSFPVGQKGPYLSTRSTARALREDLEKLIETSGDLAEVKIDFSQVEAMTISFADEFLGRFYSRMATGDFTVIVNLIGLNDEETRETVSICLERRDLVGVDADQHQLLGKAEMLADTYQVARELGRFRATELASRLKITPQNVNNRLKKLVAAGALLRQRVTDLERGGKEFGYVVPT
ncbi:STAS-like domain-containing protein [Streptosporangium subroseum]|uniref:STAS-like domain-containing protein n=1 Tax=Streptosporangium subroseum TaxID=106412 RepID=UPI003084CB4F|nr:DUF4325 domain-containing protein [Streptosporangium subroseum]